MWSHYVSCSPYEASFKVGWKALRRAAGMRLVRMMSLTRGAEDQAVQRHKLRQALLLPPLQVRTARIDCNPALLIVLH